MTVTLGFDTSNYRTSAALYDLGQNRGQNRGDFLQVPQGSLGLRQSDALFQHVRQLGQVMEQLLGSRGAGQVAAIGYSARPRNQEGSYMPCFLAGEMAARVLAATLGVAAHAYSHQQGHIASALWSADRLCWLHQAFLSWHISGGTTELLLVEPCQNELLKVTVIGGTQDVAAGQIIDRAGVALGLPFPCGAHLDALATQCPQQAKPFVPKTNGLHFSLSGLQNKFEDLLGQGKTGAPVAAFVLFSIAEVIARVTQRAQEIHPLPVLFSGGVTASSQMQQRLQGREDFSFAGQGCNGDNALGAALLAAWQTGHMPQEKGELL